MFSPMNSTHCHLPLCSASAEQKGGKEMSPHHCSLLKIRVHSPPQTLEEWDVVSYPTDQVRKWNRSTSTAAEKEEAEIRVVAT